MFCLDSQHNEHTNGVKAKNFILQVKELQNIAINSHPFTVWLLGTPSATNVTPEAGVVVSTHHVPDMACIEVLINKAVLWTYILLVFHKSHLVFVC